MLFQSFYGIEKEAANRAVEKSKTVRSLPPHIFARVAGRLAAKWNPEVDAWCNAVECLLAGLIVQNIINIMVVFKRWQTGWPPEC